MRISIPEAVKKGNLGLGICPAAPRPIVLSILVTQPTIRQTERKTEEELMKQFDQVKLALLGSLCHLVADGLGRIDSTNLERLPRMADSAKWMTACFGNNSYLEQAEQSEHDGIEAALEASQTAVILKRWQAGRTDIEVEPNELLRKLRDEAQFECFKVNLPQNAHTLSSRLRRDAPASLAVTVQIGLRKFAPSQNCIVGTKGEHIEVFQAQGGHYQKMLRFTLTDETTGQFSVDRWCFRGSIDDWFFLDCGELRKLVEKYCRHLGKESFFELM
jgi:hypothetical protein